jgi:hypothetical protein
MSDIKLTKLQELLEYHKEYIDEIIKSNYFGMVNCGKAGIIHIYPMKNEDEAMKTLCNPSIDDNEGAVDVIRWNSDNGFYERGGLDWDQITKQIIIEWNEVN